MMKIAVLLCLVSGCLSQFHDPDWKVNGWTNYGNHKFPRLPGSYPIFAGDTPTPAYITNPASKATSTPNTVPTASSNPDTTTPKPVPITTSKPDPDNCSGIFSCADCGTAQVCRPTPTGFVRLRTLPCPATTPYCNAASGSCSTTPDSTCGLTDNFICPGDGYFPDPTNCTIYHACNNYQAQMFKCAENQVYDPELTECRVGADCNFSVNCIGVAQNKLEMGDTHYFTYCSSGNPLIVSRCPGQYKLNTTSQVCEPMCEKDGLMTDLADCTKFYQCKTQYIKPNLSVIIRTNLDCPSGEAYAPDSYQCIPKTMTSCKT